MRCIFFLTIIGFLFFAHISIAEQVSQIMPIIPTPQEWKWQQGNFELNSSLSIQSSEKLQPEAESLKKLIQERTGFTLKIKPIESGAFTQKGLILSDLSSDDADEWLENYDITFTKKMYDEGYILAINQDRLVIIANSQEGCFYAIQSLRFLFSNQKEKTQLPGILLKDWPNVKLRGITDDISRGQVSTMENFKRIIRFISQYKMNVYMPYLEDMFRFKSYPSIGKDRGALTAEECVELQEYGQQYHIQIIPIFQTLGHFENILIQPEFRHLAEFPGAASLDINSEETYDFLETLLAEIVPVFKSPYFHIGADESWDVGQWSTREMTRRYGIASVHAKHYRRIFEILRKYDKKIMMYSDIILNNPLILNEIPDDVIMFDWHYGARDFYQSTETFKKADQPFIVSPGIYNWRRFFPKLTDALANIYQLTSDGLKNGAMGAITSNWGDYGGLNLRELNYYPFAFAASCAWNIADADISSFEENFFRSFYENEDPGYANVYHLLSNLTQQVSWLEFVGHPFYPLRENVIELIRRAKELHPYSQRVIEDIQRLKPSTQSNVDHLDVLSLCAEFFSWYGRLSDLKLNLYQTNNYVMDQQIKNSLAPNYQKQLNQLADEVNTLKEAYREQWLKTNRPANLHRLINLFDRLSTILQIKAEEIMNGNFSFNGKMPASFISIPVEEKEKLTVPTIYLRKQFYLDEKPEKSWLQLIADSHGKIWINGQQIGEILARKSLSGWVESKRVKSWEVTDHLNKGKNVIALQVNNYTTDGVAAANVWLEMQTEQNQKNVIFSDRYWKVHDQLNEGWQQVGFVDDNWLQAVQVPNRWIISRPYFEHGLPSRIEFYW